MKRIFIITVIGLVITSILQAKTGDTIIINEDVRLIHLSDSVYMHVTYDTIGSFGRVASNGMIMVKNRQAIMVDTPVSDRNTRYISEFLRKEWGVTLNLLIIGHHHIDCMGGINYIHSQGIKSIANTRTFKMCRELNLTIPTESFEDSLILNYNGTSVVCYYFGAGHAIDNITVWLPEYRILFGGCLIKSADANRLGNLKDAVVNDWEATINKIAAKYKNIQYIIPGHGDFGGIELLTHTIDLVKKQI